MAMQGPKLLTRQTGQTAWLRHQIKKDKMWRIIDAKDQVLGRLATQIATILQGKHKMTYFDNMDCGDPLIVINARHITLTGRKRFNKIYRHHSGYPGGLKEVKIKHVMRRRPKDILYLAVKRMLPSNKLRAVWLDNLRIFLDGEHDLNGVEPVPVPPAHIGKRLGLGGPPSYTELETWWTENIADVPDDVLAEVVEQVRDERKASSSNEAVGLAQLLQLADESEIPQAERDIHQRYLAAAEECLTKDPVIVPSSFA